MIYITKDETINFEDYGYILKTISYPELPSIRNSKESVIGKDGQYIFKDGLNNKTLSVLLTQIDSSSLLMRRGNARVIKQILLKSGKLILDYEQNIFHNANVLAGANIKFNASYDELTIAFDIEPVAYSVIDKDVTWETLDVPWASIDLPWEAIGGGFEFELSTPGDIIVNNYGNYIAKSIIKIITNGDIELTKGTESFNLTGAGTYYIDTKNHIVYDENNLNKIANMNNDGIFLKLDPGANAINVSGSFTTASIEFFNKDAYV
jgi:phage-related protein